MRPAGPAQPRPGRGRHRRGPVQEGDRPPDCTGPEGLHGLRYRRACRPDLDHGEPGRAADALQGGRGGHRRQRVRHLRRGRGCCAHVTEEGRRAGHQASHEAHQRLYRGHARGHYGAGARRFHPQVPTPSGDGV